MTALHDRRTFVHHVTKKRYIRGLYLPNVSVPEFRLPPTREQRAQDAAFLDAIISVVLRPRSPEDTRDQ